MEHYETLTSSIGGPVTYSGGPQRFHYVMPLDERRVSTVQGLIDQEQVYELVFPPDAITVLTTGSDPEEYRIKRFFACIGALLMPREGLDEHIESTIDRLNYYKGLAALPTPSSDPDPARFTAKFAGYAPRADFIIGE